MANEREARERIGDLDSFEAHGRALSLRSRRSLRSLARYARLVMLNVLNNLERILRRKLFWNIEKLRTCTTLSWSHVQQVSTVSKRLKTILNYFGVALAPSCPSWRLLRPSWRHLGTSWCPLGPSCRLLGPSWRHLAPSLAPSRAVLAPT